MKFFITYLFIPVFIIFGQNKRDSRSLGPLTFSGYEIENISEYLNGDMFIDKQFDRKELLKIIPNYDIIHLATHTFVDGENPLQSKFFINSKKADDENSVFAADILPLQLNAKLAVLSSCNTGTGKLLRGEGIESLARDFQFAGVPSVIMTLWEINDISTADIMKYFYEGLSKKKNLDEALREAKLKYLENSNSKNSAPVFWSASVPIGDMERVVFDKSFFNWNYFLILPAVLIILLIYRRKKGND